MGAVAELSAQERHLAWQKTYAEEVTKLRCFASTCSEEKVREKLQKLLKDQEYDKAAIVRDVMIKRGIS